MACLGVAVQQDDHRSLPSDFIVDPHPVHRGALFCEARRKLFGLGRHGWRIDLGSLLSESGQAGESRRKGQQRQDGPPFHK